MSVTFCKRTSTVQLNLDYLGLDYLDLFSWSCFFSWTLRRCDLQKLKWFKVHLSFQMCFNHCFDLFRTWTLETVTYIQTVNVSRSKFIIKFCFLYSLCLHFSLINIHIKSIIRTLDYLDYLINSQRVRIIEVQLYYQYV